MRKICRSDVIVSFLVLTLLVFVAGSVSERRAEIAKSNVCRSRLIRLYYASRMFARDHDDHLWPDWWSFSALTANNFSATLADVMWVYAAQDYWRNPKLLFCPSATRVASIDGSSPDPAAVFPEWGHTNWAWYAPWAPPLKATGKPAMSSYGFNDYAARPYRINPQDQSNADAVYWGSLRQEHADRIPLFFDCAWYAVTPQDTSVPTPDELDKYHYPYTFGPVSLPRHNGGVNMVFMDGRVRRVDIKELWTLKWHREFDTENRIAESNYDWPDWIEALPQSRHPRKK